MTSPEPPAGLLKASRERWAAFWASPAAERVDMQSDLPRLIRWVEQADEYDRVSKVCKKTRLVRGSTGQPVLNPLFNYLAQLEAQIARTESDFGMTPLARYRMGGDVKEDTPQEATTYDELTRRRIARGAEPPRGVDTGRS